MLIINQSRLNTKDIKPLVKFVAKRCRYAQNAYIHLTDTHYKGNGGQANYPNPFLLQTGKLHQVIVWVGKSNKYPKFSQHKKSVGWIKVNSWDEELIFLLAHELHHVQNFWSTNPEYHLEVAAEKHAIKILNEWRIKTKGVV